MKPLNLMAAISASAALPIMTNPNPECCPEPSSLTSLHPKTLPADSNSNFKLSSFAVGLMLLTTRLQGWCVRFGADRFISARWLLANSSGTMGCFAGTKLLEKSFTGSTFVFTLKDVSVFEGKFCAGPIEILIVPVGLLVALRSLEFATPFGPAWGDVWMMGSWAACWRDARGCCPGLSNVSMNCWLDTAWSLWSRDPALYRDKSFNVWNWMWKCKYSSETIYSKICLTLKMVDYAKDSQVHI